jgi:D-3-phosphoglycerate dehydrogenase / 2-oxoglutarate reductase
MDHRILVADQISPEGIEILKGGADVDVRTGLDPKELADVLPGYHGLVVRSQTKVTREALEKALQLRVVGRAGVGVDNIDVEAASERGIVVVNAPTGNTISAAELTIALLLALARNVVWADQSLHRGEWKRSSFIGVEVRGKTAGVIGLGQVGAAVARRLRAMEMNVLGFDPFVPVERAQMLGAELSTLDALLERSDFVSLHCALTPDTRHLLGAKRIRRMKHGARLVNAARGGLVDETALLEALDSGQLAGAAVDVFEEEPPGKDNPLLSHPKIVTTPHLGASTLEAQEQVAVDVAREVLQVLIGKPATAAVNAPVMDPETMAAVGPYLEVAEMCGTVAMQLGGPGWSELVLDYRGELARHDVTALKAAAVAGLLSTISEERVNAVSLPHVLSRRGWQVQERKVEDAGPYTNLVSVRLRGSAGDVVVSGTLVHGTPHIVEISGFEVDVSRSAAVRGEDHVLIVENEDRPGRIGAVGTALGEIEVNVSHMAVGRRRPGETREAIMVLSIHRRLEGKEIDSLASIPGIERIVQIRF